MKLIVFGESSNKLKILNFFQNENFVVEEAVLNENVYTKLKDTENTGLLLLNPKEKTFKEFINKKTYNKFVKVCLFEHDLKDINFDISYLFKIDFLLTNLPDKEKLEKIKKLLNISFCFNENVKRYYGNSNNTCTLESFLNLISTGFVSFDKFGNIAVVNNKFKEIVKSLGSDCNVGDSYLFLKENFKQLYLQLEKFFKSKNNNLKIIETIESDNKQLFNINITPSFVDNKLISIILIIDPNNVSFNNLYSIDLDNFNNSLNNFLNNSLKIHDIYGMGVELTKVAINLTGINRVFLSFCFEEQYVKNIFNGYSKIEIKKLKNFSYNYNIQKLIFNENNMIFENAYLLPQSKLFDFADLCIFNLKTNKQYNLLFIPIKNQREENIGILRLDIVNIENITSKSLKILVEYISHISLRIESIRVQKQSEYKEKFIRNVINNINDIVLVLDENWKILSSNTAIKKVLKLKREDVIGRKINIIFDEPTIKKIKKSMQLNDSTPIDCILKFKNQTSYLSISSSFFVNEGKKQIVLLISDISNIQKLKLNEIELERLDAISQTAITANDKINSPLTIILAHLENLKYKGKDGIKFEDLNKSAEAIEKQVNRISEIMEKLRHIRESKTKKYAQRDIFMIDIENDEN